MNDQHFLAISALQHYAYCPRQCALIHLEQAWAENFFTAEGKVLHERVDSGVAEQRRSVRYERGVALISQRYRLTGKMDLLEIEAGASPILRPVEYKRGRKKAEDWDRIQLCAQALCLEEMRDIEVTEGAIWYREQRKRETVLFDAALRRTTIDTINAAHQLFETYITPPPTKKRSRCRACSLFDICSPIAFSSDHSSSYITDIYES